MFLQRGLAAVEPLDHQPEPTHGQEILRIVHLEESRSCQQEPPALGEHLPSHPQHPLPPALTSTELKELKIQRERLWLNSAESCPRAAMPWLRRHSGRILSHAEGFTGNSNTLITAIKTALDTYFGHSGGVKNSVHLLMSKNSSSLLSPEQAFTGDPGNCMFCKCN